MKCSAGFQLWRSLDDSPSSSTTPLSWLMARSLTNHSRPLQEDLQDKRDWYCPPSKNPQKLSRLRQVRLEIVGLSKTKHSRIELELLKCEVEFD